VATWGGIIAAADGDRDGVFVGRRWVTIEKIRTVTTIYQEFFYFSEIFFVARVWLDEVRIVYVPHHESFAKSQPPA
jgi:hypothetical protein